MRIATSILRWLYGLFYVYVGGAWFLYYFLDRPWAVPEKNESAQRLVDAMSQSGIVDPLIAGTCLVGGLLLFVKRTAPLGIAILAPLVFGIFIFHVFLTGDWVWGGIHFSLLVLLAWLHRSAFRSLWSYGSTRVA